MVYAGLGKPDNKYGGLNTSTRYSCGNRVSSGSEPDTRTRPSWRSIASEWYNRATVVFAITLIREPTGWLGSYKTALRLGCVARPKPARPCCPPLRMRYVPSGRAAIHEITRFEGYEEKRNQLVSAK